MGENERTEWGDPKNEQNIKDRRIDFADLDAAFDGSTCSLNSME
jgi:uncharacterized DUF497 family protein